MSRSLILQQQDPPATFPNSVPIQLGVLDSYHPPVCVPAPSLTLCRIYNEKSSRDPPQSWPRQVCTHEIKHRDLKLRCQELRDNNLVSAKTKISVLCGLTLLKDIWYKILNYIKHCASANVIPCANSLLQSVYEVLEDFKHNILHM